MYHKAKFEARYPNHASSPESICMRRKLAKAVFYRLRDRLNGHFEVTDGANPWAAVNSLANPSISNYNTLLARRIGCNTPEADIPPTIEEA